MDATISFFISIPLIKYFFRNKLSFFLSGRRTQEISQIISKVSVLKVIAITGTCRGSAIRNISTPICNSSIVTKFTQCIIKFHNCCGSIVFNNYVSLLAECFCVIACVIVHILVTIKSDILNRFLCRFARNFLYRSTRIIASSPSLKVALFSQCGGAQSKQYRNSHFLHIIIPFRPRRG